jgi:perosamine synthetase
VSSPALEHADALPPPVPARDGVRFRHVAPAGAPIRPGDLVRWIGRLPASGRAVETLRATIRSRFGVRECFPVRTGRAGLAMLLETLARLAPGRTDVVVPAYTCYSVAASVVKAGLRPRLVDVDPTTLDFDANELAGLDGPILAIVGTNLYGMPNDMPNLTRVAERLGAFLIDDAAQAMGASVGGRPSGTWGDAGLYSLDKGKNVSAIDGGLLVTTSVPIAAAIEPRWRDLGRPGAAAVAEDAVKVLAYAALLSPSVYWIPRSIPQLGLGLTPFTTDYPIEQMPGLLGALALTMLPRLDEFTKARQARARTLIDRLGDLSGVRVPVPAAGAIPVYLRLPIMVDAAARPRVLAALGRHGIGATASYPTALADVAELRPHLVNADAAVPGARAIATQIVTLPTHPYVSDTDVDRMERVLRDVIGPVTTRTAGGGGR